MVLLRVVTSPLHRVVEGWFDGWVAMTGAELDAAGRALLAEAQVAAFSGAVRVTEWQPYDLDGSTRIQVTQPTATTHVRVETPDGSGFDIAVAAGALDLSLPSPAEMVSEW